MGRIAIGLLSLVSLVAQVGVARADAAQKPRALVFAPRASEGKAAKTSALVTREVRAGVERAELAELLPEPALDLEATELAIDCVGETAECLGEVAARSKARVLIVPSIEQSAGVTALRILYFDADGAQEARTVQRSAKGDELDRSVLDAIPEMLGELFHAKGDTEEAEAEAEPERSAPQEASEPMPSQDVQQKPLPLAPIIVAGSGLVVMAAGLAVGLMMKGTQDDYADSAVQTPDQAKQADAYRERGRHQAVAANVLLGVGAAAVVAGGIWLAVGLSSERKPAPQAMLVPSLSKDSAGLALVGAWEDGL